MNAIWWGQVSVSWNRILQEFLRIKHFTIAESSSSFELSHNSLFSKAVRVNELTGMMQGIIALRGRQLLIHLVEE
jgi:hypothetical protein